MPWSSQRIPVSDQCAWEAFSRVSFKQKGDTQKFLVVWKSPPETDAWDAVLVLLVEDPKSQQMKS